MEFYEYAMIFIGSHWKPIMDIVNLVRSANEERDFNNLYRRMLKMMEEMGEASEAYLGVTAANNHKGKTFGDLREEMADMVIVALDCAITPFPHESPNEAEADFKHFMEVKIKKWLDIKNGKQ